MRTPPPNLSEALLSEPEGLSEKLPYLECRSSEGGGGEIIQVQKTHENTRITPPTYSKQINQTIIPTSPKAWVPIIPFTCPVLLTATIESYAIIIIWMDLNNPIDSPNKPKSPAYNPVNPRGKLRRQNRQFWGHARGQPRGSPEGRDGEQNIWNKKHIQYTPRKSQVKALLIRSLK